VIAAAIGILPGLRGANGTDWPFAGDQFGGNPVCDVPPVRLRSRPLQAAPDDAAREPAAERKDQHLPEFVIAEPTALYGHGVDRAAPRDLASVGDALTASLGHPFPRGAVSATASGPPF
jgi:hypothetical protein